MRRGTRFGRMYPAIPVIIIACFLAGCTGAGNPPQQTVTATTVPVQVTTVSCIGTWINPALPEERLDVMADNTFVFNRELYGKGNFRSIDGRWHAVNETTCGLEAFLPSSGGIGMGRYSATGTVGPGNDTIRICEDEYAGCRAAFTLVRK